MYCFLLSCLFRKSIWISKLRHLQQPKYHLSSDTKSHQLTTRWRRNKFYILSNNFLTVWPRHKILLCVLCFACHKNTLFTINCSDQCHCLVSCSSGKQQLWVFGDTFGSALKTYDTFTHCCTGWHIPSLPWTHTVYFDSIPHTPSCCPKYSLEHQIWIIYLFIIYYFLLFEYRLLKYYSDQLF